MLDEELPLLDPPQTELVLLREACHISGCGIKRDDRRNQMDIAGGAGGGASKWSFQVLTRVVNDLKGRVLPEICSSYEPSEQIVALEWLQVIEALTPMHYELSQRGFSVILLSRNMAEDIAVSQKSRR